MSDVGGGRESLSPESATEALAQAREAADRAQHAVDNPPSSLPPSHESTRQAMAGDGEGNWSSNSEGLSGAANALAEAREAWSARPEPPPLSDIISGVPGG